ncbi:neuropeptide FF receptor 2-like isoform X1 [Montipora foliosa]|uniref:neuropeptide FF receptor 2-like isoform X1 n=1 Tax=Montipora foliosa TaxID=591990 RepID=UPI0035F13B47
MDSTNTVTASFNATATTNIPDDQYVREPLASNVFRLIVYSIIFLLTITGNTAVLAVVYKIRELHTVTGYLIASLAVADLNVGILCIPFTVLYFEYEYWPFGVVLCRVIPATQAICIMASIGTLTAISIERYFAIAFPWERRNTVSKVRYIIAVIWLIALLTGLPMFAVMQLENVDGLDLCMESGWPSEIFRHVYNVLSFSLTYAIPLPMITVLYTIIVQHLNRAARETSDKEGFRTAKAKGKVIRMLIIVVLFYFLCFLPYHTTYIWIEYGDGQKFRGIWLLLSYCHIMVYANSAVNPVLYGFLSQQFRRGFARLVPFCRIWKKKSTLSRYSPDTGKSGMNKSGAWA